MRACGLAGRPAWAAGLCGPSPRGPVGSISWPTPRFFCGPAGRAAGQALIAIPTEKTEERNISAILLILF